MNTDIAYSKRLNQDKHSSLFGLGVVDEEEKFCKIDTWWFKVGIIRAHHLHLANVALDDGLQAVSLNFLSMLRTIQANML